MFIFVKIFGLKELISIYYNTERKRERADFYNHGYANVKGLNQFTRSCTDPGDFPLQRHVKL